MGDPVVPLVDNSTARSGCRSWADPSRRSSTAAARDHDVGVPGLDQRVGVVAGHEHDLAGRQRAEVLDDRVDVLSGHQQHQPTCAGVGVGDLPDAAGEIGVRHRLLALAQGDPLAERGEVGLERPGGTSEVRGGGHTPHLKR